VPQPSASIIAEPVKVGDEWCVLARHPSGQRVHVRRFKTQSEAKYWIARKSKAWLKKQGYVDDYCSRQMKDSGVPASIDLFSPQCRKIPLIYLWECYGVTLEGT
jgi:hypothetical protein